MTKVDKLESEIEVLKRALKPFLAKRVKLPHHPKVLTQDIANIEVKRYDSCDILDITMYTGATYRYAVPKR